MQLRMRRFAFPPACLAPPAGKKSWQAVALSYPGSRAYSGVQIVAILGA
jgi:hypothetical protein